jgi:HD-GYP domain-containing protein (c-di-GMP phosphodiesterase class II)
MLASFSLFKECARYVRGHHERWDGNGYPDHLKEDGIPLGARIIAVADAFDAMTTTRPYRKALPIVEARRRLADGAGSQWDPRAIAAFLELLETTTLGQHEPLVLPTHTAAAA